MTKSLPLWRSELEILQMLIDERIIEKEDDDQDTLGAVTTLANEIGEVISHVDWEHEPEDTPLEALTERVYYLLNEYATEDD